MPFALLTAGLIMVVSGARDTQSALGQQLKSDFTGPNNFTWWLAAVGGVGSVGYVQALRPIANSFLVLLLVAFVLSNRGVFAQLTSAIQQGPVEVSSQQAATNAPSLLPDNTQALVGGVAQSVQAGIAADAATAAANGNTGAQNFGKLMQLLPLLF